MKKREILVLIAGLLVITAFQAVAILASDYDSPIHIKSKRAFAATPASATGFETETYLASLAEPPVTTTTTTAPPVEEPAPFFPEPEPTPPPLYSMHHVQHQFKWTECVAVPRTAPMRTFPENLEVIQTFTTQEAVERGVATNSPMHFRPGGSCSDFVYGQATPAQQAECASRLPLSAWQG